MSKTDQFLKQINDGYACKGDFIALGGALLDGEVVPDAVVKVPLRTMNRHGLIAGATGTGKTKTLQVISEQLSERGVPVLLMDVKGDLSGIAMEAMHIVKGGQVNQNQVGTFARLQRSS